MAKFSNAMVRFLGKLWRKRWWGVFAIIWELARDRASNWANTSIDANSEAVMTAVAEFINKYLSYPLRWVIIFAIFVVLAIFIHSYWTERKEVGGETADLPDKPEFPASKEERNSARQDIARISEKYFDNSQFIQADFYQDIPALKGHSGLFVGTELESVFIDFQHWLGIAGDAKKQYATIEDRQKTKGGIKKARDILLKALDSNCTELIENDVNDERISLSDAVLKAYEETRNLAAGKAAEGSAYDGKVDIEGYYAVALTGDSNVRLHGRMPPSRAMVPVPQDKIKSMFFENNANDLVGAFMDIPRYTDLEIDKSDFLKQLEVIKKWPPVSI